MKPTTPKGAPEGNPMAPELQPSPHVQARILAEALPHLIQYDEQTVVIKFGGHAMGDAALSDAFAQDIVYLKQSGVNPIVVHGGGPQIAGMLKKLEIKSDFVNGLRVTDKPTVEVVEMVLSGDTGQYPFALHFGDHTTPSTDALFAVEGPWPGRPEVTFTQDFLAPDGTPFAPQFIENKLKFSPYIAEARKNGIPVEMSTALFVRYAMKEGVKFHHIGRRDRLPTDLLEMISVAEEKTKKNTKHILNLALD